LLGEIADDLVHQLAHGVADFVRGVELARSSFGMPMLSM
jgi:hypothetical protein